MEKYANNAVGLLDTKRTEGLLKYILRILFAFIIGALAFGVLFGTFLSIMNASLEGFALGLFVGAIWALLVFAVFLPLDVFEKVKCYRKYGFIDFRVRQQRTVRIDGDCITILDTLQRVFQSHKTIHLRKKDTKRGIIEAEVGRSWRSFGEKMTVTLNWNQGNKVSVTVSSRPKIPATMFDFSKNFENVELIIQGIRNRIKEQEITAGLNTQGT
jgi:hypothetical protein